jgi:hypothetical protein
VALSSCNNPAGAWLENYPVELELRDKKRKEKINDNDRFQEEEGESCELQEDECYKAWEVCRIEDGIKKNLRKVLCRSYPRALSKAAKVACRLQLCKACRKVS